MQYGSEYKSNKIANNDAKDDSLQIFFETETNVKCYFYTIKK